MKGKIVRVNADKGFGFIKPDDGSEDCFFSFRELLPKGVTVKGNEGVEFEVGTASEGKKRPAKNVKLLSALSTAPTGATEGKETKAASVAIAPAPKPEIEVEASLDPDSDRNFLVTITVRKKGKFAPRNLRLNSTVALTVTDENKEPVDLNKLATPKEGILRLLVTFKARQATLTLILEDGQRAVIDLVK